MEIEKVQEILEGVETDFNIKNAFVKGLVLLSKYDDDIDPSFEHDRIWVTAWDKTSAMPEEDIVLMGKYGFFIDEESWSHF